MSCREEQLSCPVPARVSGQFGNQPQYVRPFIRIVFLGTAQLSNNGRALRRVRPMTTLPTLIPSADDDRL